MTDEEFLQRYTAVGHRQQSATAFYQAHENHDPERHHKHLRVGVNNAMSDHGALVDLLVDKGLITRGDYYEKVLEFAEREADSAVERARGYAPGVNFA